MRSRSLMMLCLLLSSLISLSKSPSKFNLKVAPGSISEHSVTLLWDKQQVGASYEVWMNNRKIASTQKTNFTFSSLMPGTKYRLAVSVNGSRSKYLLVRTSAKSKVFNILDYGAKADTSFINTKAIQSAIDACSQGGIVFIPKGVYSSGALYLKSNMTLYIEKGAVLKGSVHASDYLPMIRNRFEGWEMDTYASLLNAGVMNKEGGYTVKDLRITGGGTIEGGGKTLGNAMIKEKGLRGRGRLILLMNCQDVSISNLTIKEPPCWTIHYIYSNNISLFNLNIQSNTRNGDGIDPDSSTDSYIFNCNFNTGDDCIAIKSGKNPEGFYIARPTRNVRITHCTFERGHGISIGSEMSGGVSDVLVQDCKAGNLLHGMQIKGTRDRGGYVRNVTVADCELQKITIFSSVNYNNDGAPAPQVPVFENFIFRNIDLKDASIKESVIKVFGFKEPNLRSVLFQDLVLPQGALVEVKDAHKIKFERVVMINGLKPEFMIERSTEVVTD